MITSSAFYQLNYQQQADLLLSEGLYLQTRTEDNFIVDLYELNDLLIEIFYQKDNEDLVSVLAYDTRERLKTLTNGINLKPRLYFRNKGAVPPASNEYYA